MLTGKYHINDFIISKKLKNNYVNRNKICHVALADRI